MMSCRGIVCQSLNTENTVFGEIIPSLSQLLKNTWFSDIMAAI